MLYTVIRTKGKVMGLPFILDVVVKKDQAIKALEMLKIAGINSFIYLLERDEQLHPMNFIDAVSEIYKAFDE